MRSWKAPSWLASLLVCAICSSLARGADSGSSFELDTVSIRQLLRMRDKGREHMLHPLVNSNDDESFSSVHDGVVASPRRSRATSETSSHDAPRCRRTCWEQVPSSQRSGVLRMVGGSGMDWVDRRLSEALESAVRPKGGDAAMRRMADDQKAAAEKGIAGKESAESQTGDIELKNSEEASVKRTGKPWFAARLDNAFLSEIDSSLTPSNSQPSAQQIASPASGAGGDAVQPATALSASQVADGELRMDGAITITTPSDQMSRCSDPVAHSIPSDDFHFEPQSNLAMLTFVPVQEEGETTRSCRETVLPSSSRQNLGQGGNGEDRWWERLEEAGMTPQPQGLPGAVGASHRFLSNLNNDAKASSAVEGLEVPITPEAAQKDPAAAGRWFRHTLSNYPASADVHAMYGDFLSLVSGNSKAAAAMYRRALEISGEHLPSVCGIAVLIFAERRKSAATGGLTEPGKRKGSIELYWGELESLAELARTQKRHSGLAQLVYGSWLELKGDSIGAEKEYSGFIAGAEQDALPWQKTPRDWFTAWERTRFKAEALCRMGALLDRSPEEAEKAFVRAQDADPRVADGFRLHANLLLRLGGEQRNGTREEEVESLLRKAINADEGDVDSLSDYGHFLHAIRRDCYEADWYYRRALAICPRHKETLKRYSRLLDRDLGDYKAAMGMCRRAMEVEEDVETLSRYGRLLHDDEKDFDGAESVYKKVLDMDLTCVDVMHDYGRLLEEVRHDKPAAERMYRRALKVNQRHVPTLTNLGLLLEEYHGDMDGAEGMYRRALDADPEDVGTLYNYALLQTARRDHDAAEALFKRLLAVEPNDRDTLHVYGNLLLDQRRDPAAAEELFQRALHANREDIGVLCDYGRLLQGQGRNLEAEEKYQRALRVDGQHEMAMRNYASLLHDELHNTDKAEALYKLILECDPSSTAKASVLCNYARLLQEEKLDYDAAQAMYRKAIDYGVMDLRAMRAYARLLDEVRGDFASARRFYKKVLEANPLSAAHDLLTVASQRRLVADQTGAEHLLNLVLDTAECNQTHPQAAWALAETVGEIGQHQRAYQLFRQALEGDAGYSDLAFHVATSWEKRGCAAFARGLYGLVLEASAEHGRAAWMLASALEAMPGGAGAEEGFDQGKYGKGDIVHLLHCALQSNLSMVAEIHAFGAAREARGELEGCLSVYELIVNQTHGNHFPSMARTCFVLHRLLADYHRAETMYARAVETCTFDDKLMLGYGQLLEEVRCDSIGAQACYRRAQACNPTNVDVLLHLARSLHRSRRDLRSARAVYERAVILCSDRSQLAQRRKKLRAVAVDADVHVALLVNYADMLREEAVVDFNKVEDLYLAVLEHDPEHEQALLGQMFLLLDAGRDHDLVDFAMLKLVAKGCSDMRLLMEYGRWCLSDSMRRGKGVREAFAASVAIRVCNDVGAAMVGSMLRSVLRFGRAEDSVVDLPSESVEETPADGLDNTQRVMPARQDSDSTLTIETGGVDADWGCPPSQRASEVMGGDMEDSEAGAAWHHTSAAEAPSLHASATIGSEGFKPNEHVLPEGSEQWDSSTQTVSFSVGEEQQSGRLGSGWDFNASVSFGSSPVSSSAAVDRRRTTDRSSSGLSRSPVSDSAHARAGQGQGLRWADARSEHESSAIIDGEPAAGTRSESVSFRSSQDASESPREQRGPGGRRADLDRQSQRAQEFGMDASPRTRNLQDMEQADGVTSEHLASQSLCTSAQESTPQTPEAQVANIPDQWDTFVNAHKTRSLQNVPEFSTPRSSWARPDISHLPCALPRPDRFDSLECTPNCTKPVNAFAILRSAERDVNSVVFSSSSRSLHNTPLPRADSSRASSLAQDTVPCEDADGSLPAACTASLQSSSAKQVSKVNAALLVSPSSDSASFSPNDISKMVSLLGDALSPLRPSRLRPPQAALRPPLSLQSGSRSRARAPSPFKSPIRVRTIQNGEVDEFRKPRVGMEGSGIDLDQDGMWSASSYALRKRMDTLVQHVKEGEDENVSEGDVPSSEERDGESRQSSAERSVETVDAAADAHRTPRTAGGDWHAEGTPRAGTVSQAQREKDGTPVKSDSGLDWKRVGLEKRLARAEARERGPLSQHLALDEGGLDFLIDPDNAEQSVEAVAQQREDMSDDERLPELHEAQLSGREPHCRASPGGAETSLARDVDISMDVNAGTGRARKRVPTWKVVGEEKRMRREQARAQAALDLDAALDGLKELVRSPSKSPRAPRGPSMSPREGEAKSVWKDVVIATAAWRGTATTHPRRPRPALTPLPTSRLPAASTASTGRCRSRLPSLPPEDPVGIAGAGERQQAAAPAELAENANDAAAQAPAVAMARSICFDAPATEMWIAVGCAKWALAVAVEGVIMAAEDAPWAMVGGADCAASESMESAPSRICGSEVGEMGDEMQAREHSGQRDSEASGCIEVDMSGSEPEAEMGSAGEDGSHLPPESGSEVPVPPSAGWERRDESPASSRAVLPGSEWSEEDECSLTVHDRSAQEVGWSAAAVDEVERTAKGPDSAERAADERCEAAAKRLRDMRKAALERDGQSLQRAGDDISDSDGYGAVIEKMPLARAPTGPPKPWDERVFSALRGIALRREMSRAEKHKVVGEDGKVAGVRQGQCFLARAAGAPGWLRVTDERHVKQGLSLYVPMSTVAGEDLVVEVPALADNPQPAAEQDREAQARQSRRQQQERRGVDQRNYVQLLHM